MAIQHVKDELDGGYLSELFRVSSIASAQPVVEEEWKEHHCVHSEGSGSCLRAQVDRRKGGALVKRLSYMYVPYATVATRPVAHKYWIHRRIIEVASA